MAISYSISIPKYDGNKKDWFVDVTERRNRDIVRKKKKSLKSVLPFITKVFGTLPTEYRR